MTMTARNTFEDPHPLLKPLPEGRAKTPSADTVAEEGEERARVTIRGDLDRCRRRWPWLAALAGLMVVLAVYVGHPLLLRVLGQYLVVEQPLEKAAAILVLSGGVPFRAMEAAALYHQGWASTVLLTRGVQHEEDTAFQKLGIDRPEEYEYSRHVLLRLDVPTEAIVLLDKPIVNTWDELITAANWLDQHAGHRVIIVTSKTHTRRVTLMWGARAVWNKARDCALDSTRSVRFSADLVEGTTVCLQRAVGIPGTAELLARISLVKSQGWSLAVVREVSTQRQRELART